MILARLLGALRARVRAIERRWISDASERAAHQEVVVRRLQVPPDEPADAPRTDSAAR